MIKRIQIFLGPTLTQVFIAWFALTGLVSLILNSIVDQYTWVRPVQSGLVIIFVVGVLIMIASRLAPEDRGRWLALLLPAAIAVFLGLIVNSPVGVLVMGLGVGWVIAGLMLTRSKMPIEYRDAVKLLRKNQYEQAAKIMDGVIKADPNEPNHYRFRAEIYRLWGKLKQAARDYQKMAELTPDSPLAYNGLAEVYLQSRQYDLAHEAARKANQLAPDDWVTYYNLGMIEDRLHQSEAAIAHLEKALALKVKDARHRLLIHLYLARAYSRLRNSVESHRHVDAVKNHASGLEEWQTILKSDQAETLRDVLGEDIEAALGLSTGELSADDLAYIK
ncbi:MAG: tetratricopeptide repeat protein [Anaerolineae bacterium]|nr:tetratricopeptide repeat protein [Anaerolineae bacterium]